MKRLFAAARSLVYAGGFFFLWWWVVDSVRPFDDRLTLSLPVWLRLPGFILGACGLALALGFAGVFALAGVGTPAPFDPPRRFVAVGPYRFVRNPMYLGALAVILGTAMVFQSPSAIGVAIFFLTLTHLFVVLYEEPTLERRFGQAYLEYKDSVNRWLPVRRGGRGH